MTGKKFELGKGLAVFETKLGWTFMGRNPAAKRTDAAIVALSMFLNTAKTPDLWSLDVLGMKDSTEKENQLVKEQIVGDNFFKTAIYTKDKRYSVDLPGMDDHAPISQNLELSKKRLNKTVEKLKRDDLFFQYD